MIAANRVGNGSGFEADVNQLDVFWADGSLRIEQAGKAESKGNLEEACRLYADMVETYWLIRFENVFTIPLRVTVSKKPSPLT